MIEKLIKYIKNPTVQAIIAVLGLFIGVYGVYLTFYYSKKTDITYQLISDDYVIQIKEKLSKLDVSYDGKSLKENNQSLRLVTLKIANSGENTIRIGDYDEKAPLGFSLNHGEILEPPRITGSKPYFSDRILPRLESKTSVVFTPAILEPSDYFSVTTLVLVSDPSPIKIEPKGIIAGLSFGTPKFIDIKQDDKPPIYIDALGGDWSIQLIRLPSYFAGFIVALITIFGIINLPRDISFYYEDKRIRKKRIGIVNRYISKNSLRKTSVRECIFKEFTDRILFNPGMNRGSLLDLKNIVDTQLSIQNILSMHAGEEIADRFSEGPNSWKWKQVLDACNAPSNESGHIEVLKEINTELTEFLKYLKDNDCLITYSSRSDSSISIFWADPYKGNPDFLWAI